MKEAPDIVHTVSPMSYLGRMNLWKAAYDLKIPVSHVCRGPNLLELKFMGGGLDKYNAGRNAKASRYLTALAAPSGYMLKRHNTAGIRGQSFNDVIYNAIDFEPLVLSSDIMAQKEEMILYAGEIKKEKGIHTLLQATEGSGNVKLLLIGREVPTNCIREDLSGHGSRVEVMDWMEREELFKYMRRAKAVILPSEWEEPFGRILIEAVFNGTIAIGSDRGGIPEVLGNDENYIFRSGDVKVLRSRIERVLRMDEATYLEEVRKQRKITAGSTNDAYVDKWERFFLQQLK
jgi:glycosyltransferase involved in cell wall biosynthesis